MANLNESDEWADGIYQIEEDDPVLGGPTGITNTPPRQLASRGRYQRTRNVTPWLATIAYPADVAYVSHAGTTWKSVAASTGVQPGSDETKWARWAYTAAELADAIGDSMADHLAEPDPHPQYATQSDLAAHVAAPDPHTVYVPWTFAAEMAAAAGLVPDRHVPTQMAEAVLALTHGRLLKVTALSAPGTTTWTAQPATKFIIVAAIGGGGGSASVGAQGASNVAMSGGGGGGSYCLGFFSAGFAGGLAATVGAGGAAGVGSVGGNGGTTSLGSLISVPGGSGSGGATSVAAAGNGGISLGGAGGLQGSGGTLFSALGAPGGYGFYIGGSLVGGTGGSSGFGNAGPRSNGSNTPGVTAAASFGAGASGAAVASSGAAQNGGAGNSGHLLIQEFS